MGKLRALRSRSQTDLNAPASCGRFHFSSSTGRARTWPTTFPEASRRAARRSCAARSRSPISRPWPSRPTPRCCAAPPGSARSIARSAVVQPVVMQQPALLEHQKQAGGVGGAVDAVELARVTWHRPGRPWYRSGVLSGGRTTHRAGDAVALGLGRRAPHHVGERDAVDLVQRHLSAMQAAEAVTDDHVEAVRNRQRQPFDHTAIARLVSAAATGAAENIKSAAETAATACNPRQCTIPTPPFPLPPLGRQPSYSP